MKRDGLVRLTTSVLIAVFLTVAASAGAAGAQPAAGRAEGPVRSLSALTGPSATAEHEELPPWLPHSPRLALFPTRRAPLLQTAETSPCVVEAKKLASPAQLLLGETTTVELELSAFCGSEPAPLAVVLVLDRSGSMLGWPLDHAKSAAVSFVDLLDLGRSRAAVVSFASTARIDARLSHNERHIQSAIAALQADGGTSISSGLREAGRALNQVASEPNVARAIVLLTDGRDGVGREAVREQARLQREQGVHLVTIGLGMQADSALLREIATTPGDYHEAPHSSDLLAIYQSIAHRLDDIRATEVVISDRLPPDMELAADSIEPDAELAGRELVWRLPYLPSGGVRVRYDVRPQQAGWRPTNVIADAQFVDTLGRPGEAHFPVPRVLVLRGGAATPGSPRTPTVSATGTATAAEPQTPTAAGPQTPTLAPSGTSSAGGTGTPSSVSTTATPNPLHPTPGGPTESSTPAPPVTPSGSDRPYAVYFPCSLKYACRPDPRPIDLVLIIDASTTMLEKSADGTRKIDLASEASRDFVAGLDFARVRVGLVQFTDRAEVLVAPTNQPAAVMAALSALRVAEGSRIDLGLAEARRLLTSTSRETGRRMLAVLLTDGHPVGATPAETRAAAKRLSEAGTVLYVAAIGPSANESLLESLVEEPHRYLDSGDGSRLDRVYADIAGMLDCP